MPTKHQVTRISLAGLAILSSVLVWIVAKQAFSQLGNPIKIGLFAAVTILHLALISVYYFLDKRSWFSFGVGFFTALTPLLTNPLNSYTAAIPLIIFLGLLAFDYLIDKQANLYIKIQPRFIFHKPLGLLFLALSLSLSLSYYAHTSTHPPKLTLEIPDNIYEIAATAVSDVFQKQVANLEAEPTPTVSQSEIATLMKTSITPVINSFVEKNRKLVAPLLTASLFLVLETSSFMFSILTTKVISLFLWILQTKKLVEKKTESVEKEFLCIPPYCTKN